MVHTTATVAGKPVRLLSLPVRQDAQLAGVLQIAAPLIGIYGELDRLSGVLMALFPVALLVAALGGLLLTDDVGARDRPAMHVVEVARGAHGVAGSVFAGRERAVATRR